MSLGSTDSPCPDCGQGGGDCRCVSVSAQGLMSFLHDFHHTERAEVRRLLDHASSGTGTTDSDPAGASPVPPAEVEHTVAVAGSPAPPATPAAGPFGSGPWVPPAPPASGSQPWAGQWSPPQPRVPRSWNRAETPSSWDQGRAKNNGRWGALMAALVVLLVGAVAGAKLSYFPPAVPSLDSMMVSPPAAQFVEDKSSPVSGYLTSAQIEKVDGGVPLPHGVKLYGRTWRDPVDRAAFMSIAALGSSVASAEGFASGFYRAAVAQGFQPFPLTGLNGTDAAGLSLAGSSGGDLSAAVVARSRVAFAYFAVGTDSTTDQALVARAAQSFGAQLAVDPGQPSQPPASTAPHSFAYRAGEWFVALLLVATVIAGLVAVAGRKKKTTAISW